MQLNHTQQRNRTNNQTNKSENKKHNNKKRVPRFFFYYSCLPPLSFFSPTFGFFSSRFPLDVMERAPMNFVSCILCLVICTLYFPPPLTAEFLIKVASWFYGEMLMLLMLLLLLLSHMTVSHRGCLLMLWREREWTRRTLSSRPGNYHDYFWVYAYYTLYLIHCISKYRWYSVHYTLYKTIATYFLIWWLPRWCQRPGIQGRQT